MHLPGAQTPSCRNASEFCTNTYTHTHLFSTTVTQYQYNVENVDTRQLYHTGIYLQYHVCRASITSSAFWEMQSVMSVFLADWLREQY